MSISFFFLVYFSI